MCSKLDRYLKTLTDEGYYAFYAYETARDLLLRKKPSKYIIITNADIISLSKLFPSMDFMDYPKIHGENCDVEENVKLIIEEPGDRFVMPGIVHQKENYLKEVAKRAIFHINAFFYDVNNEKFYDPLDSYRYLKKKIITTISSPKREIKKHPTFALKIAKVYAETGFEIDPTIEKLLEDFHEINHYQNITEDIADDFKEILVSKYPYKAMVLLDKWGILNVILPELTKLKDVNQDKEYHPEGNAFWHTLQCLNYVKKPNVNLMMSLLLHDTGKAYGKNNGKNGKPFPNHSIISRDIAKNVLRRFYFNREDYREILFLVENHMILNAVNVLPESRLKKIFDSPYIQNLFELYRADISSGYHNMKSFHNAAHRYHEYVHKKKLKKIGILI